MLISCVALGYSEFAHEQTDHNAMVYNSTAYRVVICCRSVYIIVAATETNVQSLRPLVRPIMITMH